METPPPVWKKLKPSGLSIFCTVAGVLTCAFSLLAAIASLAAEGPTSAPVWFVAGVGLLILSQLNDLVRIMSKRL